MPITHLPLYRKLLDFISSKIPPQVSNTPNAPLSKYQQVNIQVAEPTKKVPAKRDRKPAANKQSPVSDPERQSKRLRTRKNVDSIPKTSGEPVDNGLGMNISAAA
ncbi:hypothetical protein M422DRAFT_265200 [Sphaerobolus stellatus SS14]|uniref:Uncharacterized protein n=1 Tax=Sphaerobolus stellatus (strain SS14) TaxID=990650 RepID=A0A0C9TRS7_SPHS4|nr:hypothetical protein M422DRAFT_265200 [Sphaerobolus stellatus SS14]